MVDVATQHEGSTALRYYRLAKVESRDVMGLLERVEKLTIEGMARHYSRFAPAVQKRRELFRQTPLLLDEALSSEGIFKPSWSEDISS